MEVYFCVCSLCSSIGSKLSIIEEKDLCAAGIQVNNVDFEGALNQLQAAHADAIGAPKVKRNFIFIHFRF